METDARIGSNRLYDVAAKTLQERTSMQARALTVVAFSVFFFLLRLPFLLGPWDGTDGNGHHASILLGLTSSNELLFSRVDGVATYVKDFGHPAPPYILLSLLGLISNSVVPLQSLHGQALIFSLKGVICLLQLSIFISLLLLAFRYARDWIAIAWVWILATVPVGLYAANEVQIDSSTGLFFIAVFFIAALVVGVGNLSERMRMIFLFVGGAAVGLGKNEWTVCLVVALGMATLGHLILRRFPSNGARIEPRWDDGVAVILVVTIGLVVGNLASYLIHPSDYVQGWHLIRRMIFRASILSGDTATWWTSVTQRHAYIFFHIVLVISMTILYFQQMRSYCTAVLLSFWFASALFGAYAVSYWGAYPRYFAPSYIGLGVCFLIMLLRMSSRSHQRLIVPVTAIIVAMQSAYYQWSVGHWHVRRTHPTITAYITKNEANKDCVLVLDYSYVFDRPDLNFVHAPMGDEPINAYLARIGRQACKR